VNWVTLFVMPTSRWRKDSEPTVTFKLTYLMSLMSAVSEVMLGSPDLTNRSTTTSR
jgi:hypothetical protein